MCVSFVSIQVSQVRFMCVSFVSIQGSESVLREIAESVISGRKSGAEMARLYHVSEPTVSRIVAAHRQTMELPA